LVDIFVNYDCGLEGENIFERFDFEIRKTKQSVFEKNDEMLFSERIFTNYPNVMEL